MPATLERLDLQMNGGWDPATNEHVTGVVDIMADIKKTLVEINANQVKADKWLRRLTIAFGSLAIVVLPVPLHVVPWADLANTISTVWKLSGSL